MTKLTDYPIGAYSQGERNFAWTVYNQAGTRPLASGYGAVSRKQALKKAREWRRENINR